jgi:hypothetical protein
MVTDGNARRWRSPSFPSPSLLIWLITLSA